MKFLLSL